MIAKFTTRVKEAIPRIELPPIPQQHRDTLLFAFAAIPAVEVIAAWGRAILFVLCHGGRP
jgi:hypothetical protein